MKYKNYTLQLENGRFNLIKTKFIAGEPAKGKKKATEDHTNEIVMGYALKFESALHSIINDIIEDNGDVDTIPEYIELYKKERELILDVLK